MVRYVRLVWTEHNVDHIGRHGIEPEEVEEVVEGERFVMTRLRGLRYAIIGQTNAGRYLFIVADRQANGEHRVVTARPAEQAERRLYQRRFPRG